MKSIYRGYFKPSDADYQAMWQNNIFALDTNVLLNLYRYSEETRGQLLSILDAFNADNRIWLPRKVVDEFIDNRFEVLAKQIQQYENTEKMLKTLLADLENSRQHPFVHPDTLKKVRELSETVQSELEANRQQLLSRSSNDDVLQKLGELFDGKVGANFTSEELGTIYVDGEKRVEQNIPPGFIDAKEKSKCGDNYRIYGDYIIWKQILQKAKADQRGIIFVSDDKKEDWWLEFRGRRIGPLPDLIQEFCNETEQTFYMYTVEKFIEYSGEFLEKNINPEVIKEVIDIRESVIHSGDEESIDLHRYAVINEQQLTEQLQNYENLISQDPQAYVGLKNFVTFVLGEQGYEINHSYALINNLVQQGIIDLYEVPTGLGKAKAIALRKRV